MNLQIVVMPGSHRVDLPLLRAAAQDFGWAIEIAKDIGELRSVWQRERIGAILFQQDSLGGEGSWLEALALMRAAVPGARLVACAEFSQAPDYPKLCRNGLFHLVWLPLRRSELLQCFGFIGEAERRLQLVLGPPGGAAKANKRARAAS